MFNFIGRVVLAGFIFMIMRSPLAMLLIGIAVGLMFYHLSPQKAQEGISFFTGGYFAAESNTDGCLDITPPTPTVQQGDSYGQRIQFN